ncbi:MAG: hypothetical protein HYZ42_14935, partial [Bacteroidetes bacterium]|nr:hypothetical protein [Bacteroidota bacterium]
MKQIFFIITCLLLTKNVTAQKELDEKQRQQIIEKIIENKEGGADYTDLQDQLDYYLQNPIDINYCTADELRQLSILNEIQID